MKENLLDYIGYIEKWHGTVQQYRRRFSHSPNEHLINEIFSRMEIKNGVCVEFGAWDGIHNSNTRVLIKNGWNSIQIEPVYDRFIELKKNYSGNDRVYCINNFIDAEFNLFDDVVPIKRNIDFCSIDIDGLDLDVFETFNNNLPKVVCIEGGQMLHPHHERIDSEVSKNNIQQSLGVMTEVFESKGYKLLCTYQDSFFVKEEYFDLFNVKEDIMELYLDGLEALPRFVWILQKLKESSLENLILQDIMNSCTPILPNASLEEKSKWADDNFLQIRSVIDSYRGRK